jgi:hypothetical protein
LLKYESCQLHDSQGGDVNNAMLVKYGTAATLAEKIATSWGVSFFMSVF